MYLKVTRLKSLKSSLYRRIQTTEEMETLFLQNQKQISLDTPYNFNSRWCWRLLWQSQNTIFYQFEAGNASA